MNIYLVRHGETDWNKNKLLMGQEDIPLNQNGKEQAAKVATELSDVDFDFCFSSPLSRAKETAEIICDNRLQVIEDNLLMERNAGILQGQSTIDLNWDNQDDPSIETDGQLFDRAYDFAEKIKQLQVENILVVSHNGLLKMLAHILNGGGLKDFNWSNQPSFKNSSYRIMKYEKSCGCIIVDGDKVLLVASKDSKGGIFYGFPKGHQEKGENIFETAIRETKEEVGLDVEIIDENPFIDGHFVKHGTAYKDVLLFLAKPTSGEIKRQEEEVEEAQWVALEEADKLLGIKGYYQNVWQEALQRFQKK